MINEFTGLELNPCTQCMGGPNIPEGGLSECRLPSGDGTLALAQYGLEDDTVATNVLALLGMVIVYRILVYVLLLFCYRGRR